MLISGVILNLRELCQLYHWGTMDPFLWELQADVIRWLASQPGGRSALELFLADPSEFSAELERILNPTKLPVA